MLFARELTRCGLTAVVCASVAVQAQGPTAPVAPPPRYVAIGCVSREAPAARGSGSEARAGYILTDLRGERPTVYRLDGDGATLEFHVGHTVEIAGPLTAASSAGRGQNAQALVLKVGSLTYISTTCTKR